MRERALSIGPASLVGILTQPAPADARPGAPTVLLLNSGILHRVGASRLYVSIARALAADGYASLRFDFSGIGDSEVRRDAIPMDERFVLETREAMDYLHGVLGAEHFVAGGLCSGADAGFWAALADPRICGVWQIDAFCYKTPGYYLRRYGPKLFDPRAWLHSARVRLPLAASAQPARDDELFVKAEYRRVFPPKEQVSHGLGTLLDRGVALWFFFTGGLAEYNYADQHAHAFPELHLAERARILHQPDCTHTITDLAHQALLIGDLCQWVRELPQPSQAAA